MDRFRPKIEDLLRAEPKLTNKRVGVLLLREGCDVRERQRCGYIAAVRRDLFPKEVFVHRAHVPGKTMEGDFGQSVARIAGKVTKVFYFAVRSGAAVVQCLRRHGVPARALGVLVVKRPSRGHPGRSWAGWPAGR